jgi:inhibitor of cysteine peptidase
MDERFSPNERWLTEADAGSMVELRRGDRLSISLGGNPTTGYSWQVAAVDEPPLGGGGSFTFGFQAVAAGSTALRLVYRRPWEKRRRPAQTFAVAVTVEPPGGEDHGLP